MNKISETLAGFGSWLIGELPATDRGQARWLCRCDCGATCAVLALNLKSGHSTSCGCAKSKDLTGQRFGRLTVLGRSDKRAPRGNARCRCGSAAATAVNSPTRRPTR